jgi:hypothetical protein
MAALGPGQAAAWLTVWRQQLCQWGLDRRYQLATSPAQHTHRSTAYSSYQTGGIDTAGRIAKGAVRARC